MEKEKNGLTSEEEKILTVFKNVIPELDERQKAYLLGMGEGLALKIERIKAC